MNITTEKPDYKSLKLLAKYRIDEANLLLKNGFFNGAYYLAGYSIEFSLKSYYCKQRLFPPRKTDDLYNHNLGTLLQSCGLKDKFDKATKRDKKLNAAWGAVTNWNEESRYILHKEEDVKDFIDAVNKIFLWIKKKI